MGEKLRGEADYRIIAVEPASCPSFTRGKFAYDFCDTGMICPLAKMYTLGSGFIPSPNHAGGLRFHGMSPTLSQLYADGLMEARAVEQTAVFEAAELFARCEGILPAPESSHAIRVAIDEALACRESGEAKDILFGLTGTGYFDLTAYRARLCRSAAGPGAGLNPRHQKKADAVKHSVRFLRDHACSEIFSRPGGVPRKRSITRYSGLYSTSVKTKFPPQWIRS